MADLEIDILGGSDLWRGHEEALVQAVAAAAQIEQKTGSLSVLLCTDAAIAELNLEFRGKQGPTNVLSFPPAEPFDGFLGDIALAAETIAAEAQFQGKSFDAHAAHLAVHGFLHLLGYDHETEADAQVMEAKESAALLTVGIDDPYA